MLYLEFSLQKYRPHANIKKTWATDRGHGDEHVVDALAVAQVRVVRVLEVPPGVAGVLQQVAEAGRCQDLETRHQMLSFRGKLNLSI